MSGIFGFSLKDEIDTISWIDGLEKWNRAYGQYSYDVVHNNIFVIGNHQDHLSEFFHASSPVIVRDNKFAVIDALLYNRSELLLALGYDVNLDISDEVLLLDFIEAKDFNALATVNGDFAGAIYNRITNEWTLFRDHSGVRPLYFYNHSGIFAFSTDLRGLTSLPGLDMSLNEEQLYLRMMGYNYLTLCGTDYRHIKCVRPACWMRVINKDGLWSSSENIYWKWRTKKIRLKNDTDYQTELRRLITDSIERRLNTFQGTVGCELSGGLDSSVIAILINRTGREGCFFSWSYDTDKIPLKPGMDERKVISDICAQEGISCSYYKSQEPEPVEELYSHVSPAYIDTTQIGYGSKYIRSKGVKVMFTGHGGDEGVSHRCNLYELWFQHEYIDFIRLLYRQTDGLKLRPLRTIKNLLHYLFVVQKDFKKPFHKEYANGSRFLNQQFIERMSHQVSPGPLTFAYDPVSYILQGGHRPRLDNIATQGAENGVRYMVPYLDYRVLDFALSIPRIQHHNGHENRYIFRKAFSDIMPKSLSDVHYKQTPSMQNYQSGADVHDFFYRCKDVLLNHLDREYWKNYLDFDAIEKFHFPKNYSDGEYHVTAMQLSELTKCGAIQNIVQKSATRELNNE